MFLAGSTRSVAVRSGALPERSPRYVGMQGTVKEGAHGGTMGSPVLGGGLRM